jgi:hypothetical protein
VEEPLQLRGVRPRRKAAGGRPRRQLRRGAPDLLPDAATDGAARDHRPGLSRRRQVVGGRARRFRRQHPGWDAAGGQLDVVHRAYAQSGARSGKARS